MVIKKLKKTKKTFYSKIKFFQKSFSFPKKN